MKTFNLYLLIFLVLINNTFAKSVPEWIRNPKKNCKDNNICVVGVAETLNLAKVDAKNNIQKYFETKIVSSFKNEINNNENKIKETSYEFINEETSGILKGVEIGKIFENNGKFYVFAYLDKTKITNEIEMNINLLDEQMLILYQENNALSAKKLENLYLQRLELNKKYMFLIDKQIPEIISYNQISNKIKNTKNNKTSYYIDTNNQELKTLIKNIITNNSGIITDNISNANTIVKGTITSNKEFLDVDGFEKYSLIVELLFIKDGKIINSLLKKEIDTGINFEQVYNKCMNRITTYISDNFINLME